jgi:CelD/BcsL family acetyltransferase involved in cellulose biosynthesis
LSELVHQSLALRLCWLLLFYKLLQAGKVDGRMPTSGISSETLEIWQKAFDSKCRATPFQHYHYASQLTPLDPQWTMNLDQGVAPCFLETKRGVRTVRLAGADFEDIVAIQGEEEACVESLLTHLADRSKEWDLCEFRCLLPDSALLQALNKPGGIEKLKKAYLVDILPHNTYSIVELPPTWKDYEGFLGKGLAYKMRAAKGRRDRNFASNSLRKATAETYDQDFDAFARLHTARWQARGKPGICDSPESTARLKTACRGLLEQGMLGLYTVWLDKHPAGAMLGFVDGKRYYNFNSGIDTNFQKHHPVKVLIHQAIQDCFAEGVPVFDFMKGDESYKDDWANAKVQTFRIVIAPRTLTGFTAVSTHRLHAWYKGRQRERKATAAMKSKSTQDEGLDPL